MKRIFFTEDMLQAILNGTKTETRRNVTKKFKKGEILWIPEFHKIIDGEVLYKCHLSKNKGWEMPIRMNPKHSRVKIEVTNVRIEPLHEITRKSSINEGVEKVGKKWRNYLFDSDPDRLFVNPIHSFRTLWQDIKGFKSWHANPMVKVVEFKLISK